jgi:hypothetical protein
MLFSNVLILLRKRRAVAFELTGHERKVGLRAADQEIG